MERSLLVTVRFHDGRYHGRGAWPPSPARLFQALLAGSARGAHVPDDVRRSLDWLERLPPPTIAAPAGERAKAYTNFVPNNDLDAKLAGGPKADYDSSVAATRVGKQIQPFLFSADIPLLYCWRIGEGSEHASTLKAGFNELYQLGWGVDMAWAEAKVVTSDEAQERLREHGGRVYVPSGGLTAGGTDMLCPRPGSGDSLRYRFEAMRDRFRLAKTNGKPVRVFVQPPKPYLAKHSYDAPPERIVFELREEEPERPGHYSYSPSRLSRVAHLIEEVRDEAAKCLRDAVPDMGDLIERYLIGRGAKDEDKSARVQIVPIPSIGHSEVHMAVRRIAVQVPQSCRIPADDLKWAFSQVALPDDDGVVSKELHPASSEDQVFKRYLGAALRWRSVTPLVLPIRAGFRSRQAWPRNGPMSGSYRLAEEDQAIPAVYKALRHAGIAAEVASVRVQREAFDRRGARAELFGVDTRFSRDLLWHVEIVFKQRVMGPLLLGNGRYLGLGLLRPTDSPRGVIAFAIESGLEGEATASLVTQAARRAMMARVQGASPREPLPAYVSGHEADGRPASSRQHRHLAVVADLANSRILYISPHKLQRNGDWKKVARDHRKAERAMEGMDILRAGKAGRLVLSPTIVDEEGDRLFAPARIWESVTPYDITRHRRHSDNEEALRLDVISELQRVGWPRLAPADIEVTAIRSGQRGGLSGRLRLVFPTAQAGPLLIGRTMHRGGGLFVGRKDS